MTVPIRPPDPRVMKALAAYKKQGLNRLADMAGLSQGTGDAVQSFAMGATEPLDVKGALRAARRGIEAWHGSPYKFDKFDIARSGTHGGASFGKGLNFSADVAHARAYRGGEDGNMYRVALDVTPEELLDWETPINKQPKAIQEAVNGMTASREVRDGMPFGNGGGKIRVDDIGSYWLEAKPGVRFRLTKQDISRMYGGDVPTGESLYRSAGDDDAGVSKELLRRGVLGIKHKEAGVDNYVIFDPERIQILERLAALGIGGEAVRTMLAQAKAAAQPQQSQPPTLPAVTVGR